MLFETNLVPVHSRILRVEIVPRLPRTLDEELKLLSQCPRASLERMALRATIEVFSTFSSFTFHSQPCLSTSFYQPQQSQGQVRYPRHLVVRRDFA